MKNTYTVYGINNQGATITVGAYDEYHSIAAAAAAARRDLGSGWTVIIKCYPFKEVKRFTIS